MQVRTSEKTPLLTCLLEGPTGTGKTALAATVGIESEFPYVKLISAESMVGYSEQSKASQIAKIFEDAYKASLLDPGCNTVATCHHKYFCVIESTTSMSNHYVCCTCLQ